jgi:hypothetical protein
MGRLDLMGGTANWAQMKNTNDGRPQWAIHVMETKGLQGNDM